MSRESVIYLRGCTNFKYFFPILAISLRNDLIFMELKLIRCFIHAKRQFWHPSGNWTHCAVWSNLFIILWGIQRITLILLSLLLPLEHLQSNAILQWRWDREWCWRRGNGLEWLLRAKKETHSTHFQMYLAGMHSHSWGLLWYRSSRQICSLGVSIHI